MSKPNNRRKFIKNVFLGGGAGIAGAILANRLDSALAAPSSSQTAIGGMWQEESGYSVLVFTDGTYGYTKDGDTGKVTQQTTSTTLGIQEAINLLPTSGGKVMIAADVFNLPSSFAGITLSTLRCELEFASGAKLMVPNGYTGKVLILSDGVKRAYIHGAGILGEQGAQQRLWTGVILTSGTAPAAGVFFNRIEDLHFDEPGTILELALLINSGSAYVNGNFFNDFTGTSAGNMVAIKFTNTANTLIGLDDNYFEGWVVEFNSTTGSKGYSGVAGSQNMFVGLTFFDMGAGSTNTISAKGQSTLILGGVTTAVGFTDSGVQTMILDATQIIIPFNNGSIIKQDAVGNIGIYPTPGTVEMLYFDPTGNLVLLGTSLPGVLTTNKLQIGGDGASGAINATSGSNILYLRSAGVTQTTFSSTGKISKYATRNVAGWGMPIIYGATLQKSETGADTNVLTLTPPATAGKYRFHVSISVSAANTATIGWTATWKDANGTAQAPTNLDLLKAGTALPALTFTAAAGDTYAGVWEIDIDNSATNIVIQTTFAGVSIAYLASAEIEEAQ